MSIIYWTNASNLNASSSFFVRKFLHIYTWSSSLATGKDIDVDVDVDVEITDYNPVTK